MRDSVCRAVGQSVQTRDKIIYVQVREAKVRAGKKARVSSPGASASAGTEVFGGRGLEGPGEAPHGPRAGDGARGKAKSQVPRPVSTAGTQFRHLRLLSHSKLKPQGRSGGAFALHALN